MEEVDSLACRECNDKPVSPAVVAEATDKKCRLDRGFPVRSDFFIGVKVLVVVKYKKYLIKMQGFSLH
jgi:hypothetical protein